MPDRPDVTTGKTEDGGEKERERREGCPVVFLSLPHFLWEGFPRAVLLSSHGNLWGGPADSFFFSFFFSVLRKTPLIAQPPCSGWLKFLLQWPWTRPPLTAALCGEHVGQKAQHGVPALRQGWKQMLQGRRRIESSGRCHWIHLPTSVRFQQPAFVLCGEEGKAWMVGGRGRGERHVMRNSGDLHSDHPRCDRQKKFCSGDIRRSILHKTLFPPLLF